MAKKLTEIVKNRDTASETWKKIRTELAADIAEAARLAFEHECCGILCKKLGLSATHQKEAIERIVSGPIVASPAFLILKIKELKAVTSVPAAAFGFYELVLNQYAHDFAAITSKILASAIPIAEGDLQLATAAEKNFFEEVGLPHQDTPLSAGVKTVLEKVKAHTEPFDQLKAAHRRILPPPSMQSMPEIFEEEILKKQAELAEIAKENQEAA